MYYTFQEAFKIMKEKGNYTRCCGYPFIFNIRKEDSYRIYVSGDGGDSFGYLQDFYLWMELCKSPTWIVSDDGLSSQYGLNLTWLNKKGDIVKNY